MKKILTLTFCIALYNIGIASGIEIEGIYYILDETAQKATVTYKGEADEWMLDATGATLYTSDVIIPEKVTYNSKEYVVTAIGEDAFAGCKLLKTLSLPKTISSIGAGTFTLCNGLQSISVDSENTTYFSEGGIFYSFSPREIVLTPRAIKGKVIVNKDVTVINQDAFRLCLQITEIVLPENVTRIESSAFYECRSLWRITMGNAITSIGDWAFYNCNNLAFITIPEASKSIGFNAFSECHNLIEITMNNELETIGKTAFFNCSSLRTIKLPNSLTFIDKNAFQSCSSLKTILNLSSLALTKGSTTHGGVAYYADEISDREVQIDTPSECTSFTEKTIKLDSIQASPLFNLQNISAPENGIGSKLSNHYIEYKKDTLYLSSLTQESTHYLLQKSWYYQDNLILQTNHTRYWSYQEEPTMMEKWFLEDSVEYTYDEKKQVINVKKFAENYDSGIISFFYEQKKLYNPQETLTQIRYGENQEWVLQERSTSSLDTEGNGQVVDSVWEYYDDGYRALYSVEQKTFEQGTITTKETLLYDIDFGTITSGTRETYFYNEKNLVCATFRELCSEDLQWTFAEKECISYDQNNNRLTSLIYNIKSDTKEKTEYLYTEDPQASERLQTITSYYWDNEWVKTTEEKTSTEYRNDSVCSTLGLELLPKITPQIYIGDYAPETIIFTKNSNSKTSYFYYSPIKEENDDEEPTTIPTIKQNQIWYYEGKLYSNNYPIHSIEVFTLIGEKCKQVVPKTTPIDIELPNGNYILRINNAINLHISNYK